MDENFQMVEPILIRKKFILNQKMFFFKFNLEIPVISYVLTIFNHGFILNEVIAGIMKNTGSFFELIIVDDNSSDNSFEIIKKFIENQHYPFNCTQITYIKNRLQRFEVYCDNLGIQKASGDYIALVQGDMIIKDWHYDKRIINFFHTFPDLAAISGLSVKVDPTHYLQKWKRSKGHSLKNSTFKDFIIVNYLNTKKNHFKKVFSDKKNNPKNRVAWVENFSNVMELVAKFQETGEVRFGDTSCQINREILDSKIIFFGSLINRGPIVVRRVFLKQIGGLNTKSFFQGYDDYEMSLDFVSMKKLVAYTPIDFVSNADWGAGPRKKSFYFYVLLKFYERIKARQKNSATLSNYSGTYNEHPLIGKYRLVK